MGKPNLDQISSSQTRVARMKKTTVLALSLAMIGVGLFLGGLALDSYNTGSCPGLQSPPPFRQPPCDHTMTVDGITFWIGATADEILAAGAALLASSMVVVLFARKAARTLPALCPFS